MLRSSSSLNHRGRSVYIPAEFGDDHPYMNPGGDGPHDSGSYRDRQLDREWSRRGERQKESSRYDDYYYDEDDRFHDNHRGDERYKYNGGRGRNNQWEDHKRYNRDDSRDRRDYRDFPERDRYRHARRDSREFRDRHSGNLRERSSSEYRHSEREPRARSRERRDSREWRSQGKDWGERNRNWSEYGYESSESIESTDHHRPERRSGHEDENYRDQPPNTTILVRRLPHHITKDDIWKEIVKSGLTPKDIRLVWNKDTGTSRGFAFVEFNTLPEAVQWMEMKQGILMLQDQYRAVMHYSIHKYWQVEKNVSMTAFWSCIKCGRRNFKNRTVCFKCYAPREDAEHKEVSIQPTQTVLLRGLDKIATKDSVLEAITSVSNMPIRSIRIGEDSQPNSTTNVCYLEMNRIMDAICMHNALMANPPVINGKKVLVSYCKMPQANSAGSSAMLLADLDIASHQMLTGNLSQYTLEDVPRIANYCASLYATTPAEFAAYQQYYTQYYQTQISQGSAITIPSQSQADSVNAAAAVAQSAIQHLQAAKELKKLTEDKPKTEEKTATFDVPTHTQVKPAVPAAAAVASSTISASATTAAVSGNGTALPDVSKYQYDETSGYYYDPQTGLYYDASTQYYYNSQTQQFLYWDSDKQTYLPAPVSATSEDPNSNKEDPKKLKGKPRQDKVKVAKKIAKDMERWAKTLNQKKDNARQNLTAPAMVAPAESIGTADAGYSILERRERSTLEIQAIEVDDSKEGSPVTQALPSQTSDPSCGGVGGLVAAYGGGSESEDEDDILQEEKQHTNWAKLACLLCKRQFPTKESLVRHQQLSDLHKQNLEKWYRMRGIDPSEPRRSKTSRKKSGMPHTREPDTLARYTVSSTQASASDDKGAKRGLYTPLPGERYQDRVKKMTIARFQELTD